MIFGFYVKKTPLKLAILYLTLKTLQASVINKIENKGNTDKS